MANMEDTKSWIGKSILEEFAEALRGLRMILEDGAWSCYFVSLGRKNHRLFEFRIMLQSRVI
jgi:hypothetical protein